MFVNKTVDKVLLLLFYSIEIINYQNILSLFLLYGVLFLTKTLNPNLRENDKGPRDPTGLNSEHSASRKGIPPNGTFSCTPLRSTLQPHTTMGGA